MSLASSSFPVAIATTTIIITIITASIAAIIEGRGCGVLKGI
jgi:hypothetical protein